MIKVFLIGSVLLAGWWLLRRTDGSRLALTRIAGLIFGIAWVISVMAPELVSRVANLVGVGRGTDLLLYVLVVAFMFSSIANQQKLRQLSERVATLTREQAILGHDIARRPTQDSTAR